MAQSVELRLIGMGSSPDSTRGFRAQKGSRGSVPGALSGAGSLAVAPVHDAIITSPSGAEAQGPDFPSTPGRKLRRKRTNDNQANFSPSLEKREGWNFREVGTEDIEGIMDLFKGYDSVRKSKNGITERDSDHAGHEDFTAYIPEDWDNKMQVEAFRTALNTFYLGGPFDVRARYTGEILGGVERYSEVCVFTDKHGKDKIVGVFSALTDDPYASANDRARIGRHTIKPLYAHMAIVDPDFRENRVYTYFIGRFAQKFMINGDYTQVTGGVDEVGDWMKILYGLVGMGFAPDHRPSGRYQYKDKYGKEIKGQRVIMEKSNWLLNSQRVHEAAVAKLGIPLVQNREKDTTVA